MTISAAVFLCFNDGLQATSCTQDALPRKYHGMMTIDAFKAYGTRAGSPTQMPLDEMTLLATPGTFRALSAFLMQAAQHMEEDSVEHLHLQDAWAGFDPEHHVDLILVNSNLVTAAEPQPGATAGCDTNSPDGHLP